MTRPLALAALAAALATAAPALEQTTDIVPLAEKMKQGMPTHYALVRCAALSLATAEWIVETDGDAEIAGGLAQRAGAFETAAAREAEGADVAVATFAAEWTDRFRDSGQPGDRAWKTDPLWAKDMAVCDEIAAAAR
jgi:hypothetical protein